VLLLAVVTFKSCLLLVIVTTPTINRRKQHEKENTQNKEPEKQHFAVKFHRKNKEQYFSEVISTGIFSRAFRNLSRRKIRASLVVIALGFCMAIMIALPAGIAANQTAAQNLTGNLADLINETEATINQAMTQIDCSLTQSFSSGPISGTGGSSGPQGPGPAYGGGQFGGGASKPMNESLYTDIADVSGVVAVVPVLQVVEGHEQTVSPKVNVNGVLQDSGQTFNVTVPDYIIYGVPLNASVIDNYPILPVNITQGRNLQPEDIGKVVLSVNSSAYFGKTVGDTVNILDQDFEVVGIYEPTGVEDNQLVYMDLAEAQALTNSTGTVSSLKVFAENSDIVGSVASDISSIHPELNVNTAQQRLSQLNQLKSVYDQQLQSAETIMNQTHTQAQAEIAIAVSATSVIVLFVMLYTVRERTKEIGTLKAIGASNRTVMSQFLVEGVLLSLVAGVVGIAIGTIAAPALSSILLPTVGGMTGGRMVSTGTTQATTATTIAISPELMLIGLAASVALGVNGSLYPAWRAAKIRPAEAMRYE
jgi:hypothetical protein